MPNRNQAGPPRNATGPRDGRGRGRGNHSGNRTGAGKRAGGNKGPCNPGEKTK